MVELKIDQLKIPQSIIDELHAAVLAEAAKSKAVKRKVGAIVVDYNGVILSRGHNFNPDGSACEDITGNTKDTVIHAECAALDAWESYRTMKPLHSTPYALLVTHPPCENCTRRIKESGMPFIVVEEALKFDKGKLQYDLIPPNAVKHLAEVLTYGAKKYKPENWRKQKDLSRYRNAVMRHYEAYRRGERLDPETGMPHLAHAMTNIMFLLELETDDVSE